MRQGDGKILFDTGADGLSWPLYWYFRDNPDASPFGGTLNANTDAAVIFILANRSGTPQNAAVLSKYTGVDLRIPLALPRGAVPQLRDCAGTSARALGLGQCVRSAWPGRCDQVGCRELGLDL